MRILMSAFKKSKFCIALFFGFSTVEHYTTEKMEFVKKP